MDTELNALLDLYAAQAIQEFWKSARRAVHSALPVAACWFAPSPEWVAPCAAFRAEISLTEPEFRRFERLHPLGMFLRADPNKRLARLSDLLSDVALLNSKFYREFLEPYGHRFCVVLNFRQGTSSQGLLGLHRGEGDRDFSRAELHTIEDLHRHIETALRRACLLHRERSAHRALELLVSLPVPMAILDWRLAVLYCNHAARQLSVFWKAGCESARSLKCDEQFELPDGFVGIVRSVKWNGIRGHMFGRRRATIR